MTQLSVVLITKNQQWNVPRMVESVLAEVAAIPNTEVVLVDSASSDRTVDIASTYPIGVVRLDGDQRLTAGMGRYVGYCHTTGDYVLFLDGDMELGQGWLRRALDVMRDCPDVAVITGQVIDQPVDTPYEGHFVTPPHVNGDLRCSELPYTGGAALYRRTVLQDVGTFHPYVYSDEEPELCVRIRHRGHRIVKLDYPIAYHYSRPTEAISTLFARWRRNLYLGAGQNLRYNLGQSTFLPYVRQRGYGLIPAVGLAVGVTCLVWSAQTGKWYAFAVWVVVLLVVLAADTYRKRSFYRALYTLILRVLIMDGTFRGFLLPPQDTERYPVRFQVVRAQA